MKKIIDEDNINSYDLKFNFTHNIINKGLYFFYDNKLYLYIINKKIYINNKFTFNYFENIKKKFNIKRRIPFIMSPSGENLIYSVFDKKIFENFNTNNNLSEDDINSYDIKFNFIRNSYETQICLCFYYDKKLYLYIYDDLLYINKKYTNNSFENIRKYFNIKRTTDFNSVAEEIIDHEIYR
ncbi:hypothetical protein M0Q50_05285 [bacterium]|jgi:hypothetical protein|nr:hypothetical protein [bacterium]